MLVDMNTLRGLAQDLGPEALGTLIGLFRDDAGETVKKLEAILVSHDSHALALEAHTLKSVAATYGALDALVLARELDAACKKQVPAVELLPQVKELIMVLKSTIAEIGKVNLQTLL